jgi:hypothetical protein
MTPMNPLFNPGPLLVIGAILLAHRAHRHDVEHYYDRQPRPNAPHPSNWLLHIVRFFMYSAALSLPFILIQCLVTRTFCGIPFEHVLPRR